MSNTQDTAPVVLVKWKTPEDELINTARMAQALKKQHSDSPIRVCIAVPGNAWASQAAKSLQMLDVPAVPYMPVRRLEPQTRAALAAIDFLAKQDDASREALMACGKTAAECNQLLEQYGNAHGFALLRATGMKSARQLQHVMTMFDGDEDAATIAQVAREQLAHPHAREDSEEVVIMDYRSLSGSFDYLFVIACVDGLVGNSTQEPDERALKAFRGAAQHAKRSSFISYFTRIDKTTADRARINYARCKTENGALLAMTKPTPFLAMDTHARPSTTSGQALLRTYGLN